MYLIGQDYSFGKAVAAAAEKYLAEKTSINIVGNELHPIGKVKDFTPYARKILASGADAVITGNWGADMVNLGKSLSESGYKGPIYCYYCATENLEHFSKSQDRTQYSVPLCSALGTRVTFPHLT